jgi:predicted  nucleic acid-binding Zn-ribbon protein
MDPHVPPSSHPFPALGGPAPERDAVRARDALRVQAAAIAAQQAALDEREQALAGREQELARRERRLSELEQSLGGADMRHAGDFILARHRLNEGWDELRQARQRWRRRRGNEHAVLRVRADEIEQAAAQLEHVRHQLRTEQESWRAARAALEVEVDGLNQRAVSQRQVLAKLEEQRRQLDQALGGDPGVEQVSNAPSSLTDASRPQDQDGHAAAIAELEALAGALADQRLLLIEGWQRLARLHAEWHEERQQLAAELEALGGRLLEQDLGLQAREQICVQTETALTERHEQWLRDHRQVVAWRARLRADEEAWQREKNRLLAECRHKQAVAEQQMTALADLRQRWHRRRKLEVEQLRSERETLESFRKEFARLRQELATRAVQLEEDQRILIEKTLAVEQFRNETTTSAANPEEAEHRLDLLRRRWIMHNAVTIRAVRRQRSALQRELQTLEARYEALQNRSLTLEAAETALADKRAGREHHQIGVKAHHRGLEYELERAQSQQARAEQECAGLRDEIERIARALLEEPESPQQTPLAA